MAHDRPTRTVLIGWDSANWEMVNPLLDTDRLPHLSGLIQSGVMGTMLSPGPPIGAIAYNTVATGTHADRHGVLSAHEVRADRTVAPSNSLSRRRKAFWDILSYHDRRCHVVNFPATGPAEHVNGVFVSPAFFSTVPVSYRGTFEIPADSVCPAELLETLKPFIVSLEDIDPQTMAMFVPRAGELGENYRRLGPIASTVTRTLSIHTVATWLMENAEWDTISVNYPAINLLWAEFGQYRPPRSSWVDPTEYDLFGHVTNSAVQLCDLLLGRLLALCGDDTAVVLYSPLGYGRSQPLGQQEPSIPPISAAVTRTPGGIFAMRAPTAHKDELLHRVSSVDVCPTVLHLCGLALPDDLDGEIPQGAFAEPTPPIETLESAPAELSSDAGRQGLPPIMPWPEATGFLAPYSDRPAWRVQMGNDWNLAEVLLATHRSRRALPLMVRLYATNPLQVNRGVVVAEALYWAGLVPEALAVISPIAEAVPQSPTGLFMAGMIAFYRGDVYHALDLFEAAGKGNRPIPELLFYLGHVYARMDKLPRAIRAFQQSLEIAPDLVRSHLGLSNALYRLRQYAPAAQAALNAIGLDFSDPVSHIALGKALAKLHETDRAEQAFEAALRVDEKNATARRWLAWIRRNGTPSDPGDAALDDDTPSDWLRSMSRQTNYLACQAAVQAARRAVTLWNQRFVKDLVAADRHLDAYLVANAAARQVTWSSTSAPDDADRVGHGMDEARWMIRPALPSDQPALRRAFEDIFACPYDVDVLVLHPADRRDAQGVIAMQLVGEQGQEVELRLSLGGERAGSQDDGPPPVLMTRLLRAAVACAAARGAQRVTYTIPNDDRQRPLRGCLEKLGFEVTSTQNHYVMNETVMQTFGQRCRELFERYRHEKGIPKEVRLVTLRDVPYEQVDGFLRQFFPDGAEAPLARLAPPLCPVILKGNEVIAAFVGYRKDQKTFVVTRLGVLAAYRGPLALWVLPGLLGPALKEMSTSGCRAVDFFIDEAKYPEFAKVARSMKAELVGDILITSIDLAIPWQQSSAT